MVSLNVTTVVSPDTGGAILFSDNPPYKTGQTITITAAASQNYKFSHWEGDLSGTEVSKQLDLSNSDIEVVAYLYTIRALCSTEHCTIQGARDRPKRVYFYDGRTGRKMHIW